MIFFVWGNLGGTENLWGAHAPQAPRSYALVLNCQKHAHETITFSNIFWRGGGGGGKSPVRASRANGFALHPIFSPSKSWLRPYL